MLQVYSSRFGDEAACTGTGRTGWREVVIDGVISREEVVWGGRLGIMEWLTLDVYKSKLKAWKAERTAKWLREKNLPALWNSHRTFAG